MHKSELSEDTGFFSRYIETVTQDDLIEALIESQRQVETLDVPKILALEELTYAPEKWTAKDILQHIIDTERILSYRALRFGRGDTTTLPGFDEPQYANFAEANRREAEELIDELRIVKVSTFMLFNSFPKNALANKGLAFDVTLSAGALGFMICGHQNHHLRVLEEKYFPLLSQS